MVHYLKGLTRIELACILVIIAVLIAFLFPELQQVSNSRRREYFKYQMKSVGLALHLYQDEYGCLPPVMLKDDEGIPIHSWRALLLPFLKQQETFKNHQLDYALNEPWDSLHNRTVASSSSSLFRVDWMLQNDAKIESKLVAIHDSVYWNGSQDVHSLIAGKNTDEHILLMEIPHLRCVWTEPVDLSMKELRKLIDAGAFSPLGSYVLYADGHVGWLSPEEITSPDFLKRLMVKNVSEVREL